MDTCYECARKLPADEDYAKCSACKGGFHYGCATVRESQFRKLSADARSSWRCPRCKCRSGSVTEIADSKAETESPEYQLMKRAVREVVDQEIGALKTQMTDFVNYMSQQFADLKIAMQEREKKVDECLSRMDTLTTENARLTKENEDLKMRMNHAEQYSRMNCVEIRGVPEPRQENIMSTIGAVARAVNFNLEESMVDACHRLQGDQRHPTEPRSIILKFVSRLQKDRFVEARKVRRTLSTRDLDPASSIAKPIYINESLSPYNRVLFGRCREFKKENGIKFLWFKNGKIRMRREEGSKVYIISTVSDLNDVH